MNEREQVRHGLISSHLRIDLEASAQKGCSRLHLLEPGVQLPQCRRAREIPTLGHLLAGQSKQDGGGVRRAEAVTVQGPLPVLQVVLLKYAPNRFANHLSGEKRLTVWSVDARQMVLSCRGLAALFCACLAAG